MTAFQVRWPTREGRWRKPAIVAASLGLHVVVLGYMAVDEFKAGRRYGLAAPGAEKPLTPVYYLDLRPRIPRREETTSSAASPALTPSVVTAGETPSAPRPRFTTPEAAEAAPASSGGGAVTWQARPESAGDRIERQVRTSALGCANAQFLSLVERDICDERAGARAEMAVPIARARTTGDESFERTAQANDAWREYKTGEGAYPGLRSLFTDR